MSNLGKMQKLFRFLVSEKTFAAMERSSRAYVGTCKSCACDFSIWDAGGIRYGASGDRKHTSARCPHCNTAQMVKFKRDPMGRSH